MAGTRLAVRGAETTFMKRIIANSILVLLTVLVTSGPAQNPPTEVEQKLAALVQQIQAQQAQITANQEKIDAKMAEVTEAVRVARIFAGRGGK
jgi:ABC-type transporter MlaC component